MELSDMLTINYCYISTQIIQYMKSQNIHYALIILMIIYETVKLTL